MKLEVIEGDWLDAYLATGELPDVPPAPKWTPEAVEAQLVEALRWAKYNAGRVGPAGIGGVSGVFSLVSTLEDHMEEGWGIPEVAGDDVPDEKQIRPAATPEQITRHEAALQWPADYLLPDYKGSARMVGLWCACQVGKRSFNGVCKARGVDRHAAMQLRDRGLSLISQGLTRDGVPVEAS
jgi:hypothetical protein